MSEPRSHQGADDFDGLIRSLDDRPPDYVVPCLRGVAASAGIDFDALCAERYGCYARELSSEACAVLLGILKRRLATLDVAARERNERGAHERVPEVRC